ncbi:hypothetical protein DL98DRAFT_635944 [Cadophora sp. DSE1049]|nr:hypothetical protein DL98DRAFT_635944 [Cadophora sp. DSE1049]
MEFQFVNSTISCPTVPQDLAVRSMIRKQAMKQASAARKRTGNYGKHNLRQYPIFLYDQDILEAESTNLGMEVSVFSESIPRSPCAQGFELTCTKTNFNILLLSSLATLHVCRPVRQLLSQSPNRLVVQLKAHRRSSYFTYIPSRYDDVPCLRDAIDCVIARTQQIISPDPSTEWQALRSYVKALRSLQAALDDPEQRLQPEVLCATEILALYELLDPSGEAAWVRHAAGAARLIRLRGPRSFKTDFQKSLFVAQCISIPTEGVLNSERCFLEEKPWQETLRSVIEPDTLITDRSEIVIELIMLKSFLPGAFVDVTTVVCNNRDPDSEYLASLIIRIRKLRDDFLDWCTRYKAILNQCCLEPGNPYHDSHCKVWSHYLSSIMIAQRMLACISPSDRKDMGKETQDLANQMLDLEVEAATSPTNVFMALTVAVSHTVFVTAKDWRGDDNAEDSQGLIAKKKLVRWCNLLGRKMLEKEHPREGREMFSV